MPYHVYADQRKNGYVLTEMYGLSSASSTSRLWPPAKLDNGRGRVFKTFSEACAWAKEYKDRPTVQPDQCDKNTDKNDD